MTLLEPGTSSAEKFPNGTVMNFNAHFCAHGDQQLEGINVTTAFLHATLEMMKMSMWICLLVSSSFQMESSRFFVSRKLFTACIKVLVLFRNILMRNFGNCSLPQASFDPCLFIGKMDIDICYVDDLIFWARNENDIVELAIQLHAKGVDLEQEDNAA